jgi:hypothetical protein
MTEGALQKYMKFSEYFGIRHEDGPEATDFNDKKLIKKLEKYKKDVSYIDFNL